jgi:hypothetical protein
MSVNLTSTPIGRGGVNPRPILNASWYQTNFGD